MKAQNSHVVGGMFFSWLVGLLYGFHYGLNGAWDSLMLYIYFMIIVIGVFISITVIKNFKEQEGKK